MYPLRCAVQNYHWGKKGSQSVVAELKRDGDPSFQIKETEPYAEYWFGTHPSGPSEVFVDGKYELLKTFLEAHPAMLGQSKGLERRELPFLSKVLSVDTALSIQAHPDKELAEVLHAKKPDMYKDDNHKPEMAYALGDFVAMCGFRPAEEIAQNLRECVYLRDLIGAPICEEFEKAVAAHADVKPSLRKLFTAFIEASPSHVQTQLDGMKSYLASKSSLTFVEQWIATLLSQYPSDAGVFAPLLLNVLSLHKGDAIYLGADIPHAYLSGDIVETMACSNNVVRAGLTPKAIDKETLVSMLTYECGPVTVLRGRERSAEYAVVETPAEEFMIEVITVKKGERFAIPAIPVPRVLIWYEGRGVVEGSEGRVNGGRGAILFQAAGNEGEIVAEEDVVVYATHEKCWGVCWCYDIGAVML